MRKYLWLILVFAFVGMNAQNLDSLINVSGWEDFDGYKKQKLIIGDITYRQISKDRSKLFTADSNKYFKLWDLETGKLLKSINIEHQLPVFLLNDTLILFRASTKNPSYQSYVYGYSLNNEIEYLYLEHEFVGMTTIGLINYSSIQLLSDTVLVIPKEDYYISGSNYYFSLRGTLYNTKTKEMLKEYIKFNIYNKITFIDSNKYYADAINATRNKYGQITYNFSINFYDSLKASSLRINNNQPGNHRSIVSDTQNGRIIICEFNKLSIINSNTKTFYKEVILLDTLTSLCLYDSTTVVGLNKNGTALVTYNWMKDTYEYFDISNETKIFSALAINQPPDILLTSNKGDIILKKMNFIDKVYFKSDTKKTTMEKDIKFSNYSSINQDSFKWEFGDGEISNDVHTKHFYKKEGIYYIKLTAYKNDKSSTYIDSVEILPNYYPSFEIDKSYGYSPLTVRFKNYSDFEADSLEWDFGDGTDFIRNQNELSHTFSGNSDYKISLTAYKAGEKYKSSKIVNSQLKSDQNFIMKRIQKTEINHVQFDLYSYERTIYPFGNLISTSDNNYLYFFSKEVTNATRDHSTSKYTYYACTMQNNGFSKIINENFPYKEVYPYLNGGVIYIQNDSLSICNRNTELQFRIKENGFKEFYPISNKYLIAKSNKGIAFFDKYFNIMKEFNNEELLHNENDIVSKITYFQNRNRFQVNQNIFVLIQSKSKNLDIIEFDQDFSIKNSFLVENCELNSSDVTENNEICIISKSGKLKIVDLSNNTIASFDEMNYTNYNYYNKSILFKFDISYNYQNFAAGLDIKFIDYQGNLVYNHIDTTGLVNNLIENGFIKFNLLLKSFDNKFYYFSNGFTHEYYSFSSIYFNDLIPSSILTNDRNSKSPLFPNPTSDYINLNNADICNLKIYDLNGIELDCETEYFENMVRINTSHLQTGIYFVRYEINGKIYNEKFVKY